MNFKSNIPTVNNTKFNNLSDKFLENKVRFSSKYTEINKKFCILNCSPNELQGLYKTLWEKESLTWHKLKSLPRERWISIEKKKNTNHKLLEEINNNFNTFWHIRIKNTNNVWRIFWWIKNDLFYIILIDIKWKINH